MKLVFEKIESLNSTHIDKNQDRLPKVHKWQMRVAQMGFQTVGRIFPQWMAKQAYAIFSTPRWRAKHARTDEIIDSAVVFDFAFEGQIIKVYEWGNPKDKIILLAHGWESRGTALRMYVAPLVGLGYCVVAYDAVGHGDSGGKQNNVPTNAQTITALIHHYNGIYGAIGHSFGCSGLVYALQYVDNTLSIEKLVFLAVPYKTKKIIESFFTAIKAPDGLKKSFYSIVEKLNNRSIDDIDITKSYLHVKVGQLLLIHDRFDDVTGIDAAEEIVHQWDNAKLLVTEGYGHFRIAKNPDVLKRIVAFITDN